MFVMAEFEEVGVTLNDLCVKQVSDSEYTVTTGKPTVRASKTLLDAKTKKPAEFVSWPISLSPKTREEIINAVKA